MKAYELKALLATLDDSAEVSIELNTSEGDTWSATPWFGVESSCGCAPRSATLFVNAEYLKVIPNAQERIEELEQERDDLKAEFQIVKNQATDLISLLANERESCTAIELACADLERSMF